MWAAVLAGIAGCYLCKLAGLSVPNRVLHDARTQRVGLLIPVALLAALAAVQTFSTGQSIVFDARTAAIGVAVVAILLRLPFLVVVALAAATAALLRLLV